MVARLPVYAGIDAQEQRLVPFHRHIRIDRGVSATHRRTLPQQHAVRDKLEDGTFFRMVTRVVDRHRRLEAVRTVQLHIQFRRRVCRHTGKVLFSRHGHAPSEEVEIPCGFTPGLCRLGDIQITDGHFLGIDKTSRQNCGKEKCTHGSFPICPVTLHSRRRVMPPASSPAPAVPRRGVSV